MKLIVLLKSTNFVQLIQKMMSWTTFQILNSFSHSVLYLHRTYSRHHELWSQDSSFSRRAPVPRLIFQHLAPVQTSRPKTGITNVWGDIGLQEQKHKQRRRCELQMLKQDGKPEFLLWQRDKIPSWEREILNLALSLWPEWPWAGFPLPRLWNEKIGQDIWLSNLRSSEHPWWPEHGDHGEKLRGLWNTSGSAAQQLCSNLS